MERRGFCRTMAGIAAGVAALGGPGAAPVLAQDDNDDRQLADVARLYRLQAEFHRAKTTQDINLMMSLWDVDCSLTIPGNPNSPFIGLDQVRSLLLTTGSFTHLRFSLVPSFKIQINVHGDQAFFYEECHDVADFALPSRSIAGDTYLAGTVRKVEGKWLFWHMFGGSANPLSVDHYYFP